MLAWQISWIGAVVVGFLFMGVPVILFINAFYRDQMQSLKHRKIRHIKWCRISGYRSSFEDDVTEAEIWSLRD